MATIISAPGDPLKRTRENARLEVAIQAAHVRTWQTYGPARLQEELREDGFPAVIGRIKRLRKKLGLHCAPVERFTLTTDSAHLLLVEERFSWRNYSSRHARTRAGSPTSRSCHPQKAGWVSPALKVSSLARCWVMRRRPG